MAGSGSQAVARHSIPDNIQGNQAGRASHVMKNLLRHLSPAYAAGSVGGLITTLAVWIFGVLGITGALGVKFAPALTSEFL